MFGFSSHDDFQRGNLAFIAKKYDEAIAHFLKHAAKKAEDSADAFAKIAECYRRQNVVTTPIKISDEFELVSAGDDRMAEYYYRLALKKNPSHVPSLKGLVAILPEGSEYRLEVLETLQRIQPDYLVILELGHWYLRKAKDPARAYQFYLDAQKLKPKDREAYDRLQDVCQHLGKMDEAADWKKRWAEVYQTKRRHI